MAKFCCVCGKKGDFPNYTCPDCSPPAETPEPQKKAEVPLCKKCGRVYKKGRWVAGTADNTKVTVCPDCGFIQQAGYRAVIQFSGNFAGNKPEIDEIIDETLERESSRGRLAAVTKVEGTHYYFNSIRAAEHVARRIAGRFGAKLKETSKLIGYDAAKGKGRYKITFSINIP